MGSKSALQGKRILIAEDNLLAAMELEHTLLELGCKPLGPVATVSDALRLIEQEELDGALLDVDLRGEFAFGVAEALEARGAPVVFATGYDDAGPIFPEGFASYPRLRKPYAEQEVARVLTTVFCRT